MTKIQHGDTVHFTGMPERTATAFSNPDNVNELVAVFTGHFGRYVTIFDEDGNDKRGYAEVTKVDRARIAWDALDYAVREVLIHTRYDKKILAIKALRTLTGLSLPDAKRAVEEFAA